MGNKLLILSLFLLGLLVGTVTYEKEKQVEPEIVQSIVARCKDLGSGGTYISCLRKEFSHIVRSDNLTSIMQTIEKATATSAVSAQTSTTSCHEIGHIVGGLAQQSGGAPGHLLAACGRSCGYGCAHGVMAGILREDPSRVHALEALCSSVTRSESIACNHGVGHGLADFTAYDLTRALTLCDEFGQMSAKKECATGVFMEVFEAPTQTHVPQEVPKALDYCNTFPIFAKDVCEGTVAVEIYSKTQNIVSAFETCRYLPSDSKDKCAGAVGAKAYFVEDGDAKLVVSACSQDITFTFACLTGALTSSLVIDGTGISGQEICRASGGGILPLCIKSLQRQYDEMTK